ncbi:hypothetical protein [Lentzea sp.]|uniref:hypothetical protein n=1 Tax=Lentzea sp. TaxID=56099 RepID=UPI002C4C57FB|nr:hypothetical protein [Lentzea sp.]HUQ62052.1 hypothetical protein [Lentzea sp.]
MGGRRGPALDPLPRGAQLVGGTTGDASAPAADSSEWAVRSSRRQSFPRPLRRNHSP